MKLRALLLALLCLLAAAVSAHEVRPAYLELRQTGAETYDVLWKVPARGDDLLWDPLTVAREVQRVVDRVRGRRNHPLWGMSRA